MNTPWYAHYPGDYGRDTAHLSLAQHGAYRLLLDHYYSTAAPLPSDVTALRRICRAFDQVEQNAVDSVLREFFELRADGYHNSRADRELTKQAEIHERLSRAARKGNEKRWGASSPGNREVSRLAIANPQPQPQPKEEKKEGAPAPPSLSFSGQHFSVTEKQDAILGEAFPWIDRPAEYHKVDSWLEANPERRPKKANRFLHNWFSRIAQPGKGGSNGNLVTFAEKRSQKNADAIQRVLGRAEEASSDIRRALPPAHN